MKKRLINPGISLLGQIPKPIIWLNEGQKTLQYFSLLILVLIVFSSCTSKKNGRSSENTNGLSGTISISGAFALYPLAVKWGEEFSKLHPGVNFDIQGGGAGKGMTDVLSGTVTLGMLSREVRHEETERGAVLFPSAKDAVLPTFSAANPHAALIAKRGVTLDEFKDIWINQTITTWGQLLGINDNSRIKVYTRSDAAGAAESWSLGIGGKTQEDLKGIAVFADPGLLGAVIKDRHSIGFNNIGFAYNIRTNKLNEGVGVVPIDVNKNGQIDPEEDFYGNLNDLMEAIIDGRFPSPPARDLFFVTRNVPEDAATRAFLRWVMTEGQEYVKEMGYVGVSEESRQGAYNLIK